MSSWNTVQTTLAVSAFGLVLALWSVGVIWWARRRSRRKAKIQERLDPTALEAGKERTLRLWHEGEEATKTVPDQIKAPPLMDRLEQMRKDAGFKTPVRTLLLEAALAVVAAGLVFGVLTERLVPAIVASSACLTAIIWYASQRIQQREQMFERQLVDGLELSARALRAGHPLLGAFHLIAEEIPAPVGMIFAEICQHQAMGGNLDDALRRAAALTKNQDMKLFSASLSINLRTGGNLADVVYGLAHVIRERMRLNRRFRVLIAQTQVSKRILLILPVAMFGVLSWIAPEYVEKLFDNLAGNIMLATASLSLLIGWIVMNRMAALRA